jgi:subtilisin family serine protease
VDDIYGWGYLGNAKGDNIRYETYEFVRVVRKLGPKYQYVKSVSELPAADREEYKTYLQCKKNYEEKLADYQTQKANLDAFSKRLDDSEAIIAKHLKKKSFSPEEVKQISTLDQNVNNAKAWLLQIYSLNFKREMLTEIKEHVEEQLNQHLNINYNPRTITADNPEDINNRKYGNSNVIGSRADHGTPVAGIIAGVRNNKTGIDGIAEDVKIMVLRAVPNGDEYDKDIALAIRYAVDNGANIINMSFGKGFSPQKSFVDEAVKYAEQHNVLLVHAAGNDGQNNDHKPNFPNKRLNDGSSVNNWLEVGATSMQADKKFCAVFSNYGRESVDLFAPGVDVVSLAPDNKYNKMDGTSFAGPVVSGVAALVWSYYPELSAVELKDVLKQSSTKYTKLKVYYPNVETPKKKKTKFSKLSSSGGVVNAYEALKLADKMVQEKGQEI